MPDAMAAVNECLSLANKAAAIGLPASTGIEAFREKLFPTYFGKGPGEQSAYLDCPEEFKADVLDAVDNCTGDAY